MTYQTYDWREYGKLLTLLGQEVKQLMYATRFESVYGFPRGGIPIAVYLSHKLKLRYTPVAEDAAICLVVDDILDTGRTAQHAYDRGYAIACLHWRVTCPIRPAIHIQ